MILLMLTLHTNRILTRAPSLLQDDDDDDGDAVGDADRFDAGALVILISILLVRFDYLYSVDTQYSILYTR